MLRIKYFWPLLCCLLVAMVCYQSARIKIQADKINSLRFDLNLEKFKTSRYDSMLTDCQAAIEGATDSLKKMNGILTDAGVK